MAYAMIETQDLIIVIGHRCVRARVAQALGTFMPVKA